MPSPTGPRARRADESGVALVLGVLFTIIVAGLVATGTLVLRAHRAKIETNYRLHGQAVQFARAGLIEALGWFRKSKAQPVTTFEPVLDPGATPPVLETLDPDIGIVREFQISGPVWGRYEVWKKWDSDPDPQRLAWRQKVQVEDISEHAGAGAAGSGNVWLLRSVAYVFRRVDPSVRYDTSPNQVLGTDILGTEIRRMTLAPPGQAAICLEQGGACTVRSRCNLQGGTGAAIFHKRKTGSVNVSGSPRIEGSPGISSNTVYEGSVEAVFGVAASELRVLADNRITSVPDFPSPLATSQLYYVEVPRLDIGPGNPLLGSAVIFVEGDVALQYNSKSYFTGLLYVDGDITIREPCEFNGTLICTGSVTVDGQSDWINISYDDAALNRLRTEIGQYRLSSAIRRVLATE